MRAETRANGRNGNKLVTMEAGVYGGGNIEPLLPSNLMFENVFRSFWRQKKGPDQYKQARELALTSDFFSSLIFLKESFFNDRLNFGEADNKKFAAWLSNPSLTATDKPYDFARVVNDTWQEWLTCDNVVAFWNEGDGKTLPVVSILDCEICDYKNSFGIETLTIKVPKVTLKTEELARLKAKGMDKRYLDTIKEGKDLVLDESKGEFFEVLTRAKLGKGLAPPRIGAVLQQLSTMELFNIGDWAAAFTMKKVVRQVTKGHEIRNGPLSGQATHFIKSKESKQIKSMLQGKDGAHDVISNFDVAFKFPFMDPKYFDAKKMEGTLNRLERWAGPLALMMGDPTTVPFLMDFFKQEGFRQREIVGNFLSRIFGHPAFLGNSKPPIPLMPRWNPTSFTTQKMLGELLRLGYSNGLISPQTSREWMNLDDENEGDRMEKAAKKKKRFTPVFEAKQGMASGNPKGGRPGDAPAGGPIEEN